MMIQSYEVGRGEKLARSMEKKAARLANARVRSAQLTEAYRAKAKTTENILTASAGAAQFLKDRPQEVYTDTVMRSALTKAGIPLEKAGAVVGNPTQGQAISNSPFAALIPQDIAPYWYSQVAPERKRISLLTYLNKETVQQRFREKSVVTRHTDHLMPVATAETAIPGISNSSIDKRIATTRYWRELRSISHPAMNVTILGAQYPLVQARDKGGLQFEQREGSLGLAEKMEIAYWYGKNSQNAEEGDGFFEQVRNGGVEDTNWYDLRGGQLSFDLILQGLARVSQDGFEGEPDTVFLPGPVWASLSSEAAAKNRLDPDKAKVGDIVWNKAMTQLMLIGPSGTPVALREARLLYPSYYRTPPSAGAGEFTALVLGNLSAGSPSTPVDAASQFTADDVGTYSYRVVAAYSQGYSAALSVNSVAVAEGDVVTFEWDDAAFGSASNPFLGYHVWRNTLTNLTSFGYIGFFGKNTDGPTDNGTTFDDTNATIPGCYSVGATHGADGAISDDVLLDTNIVTLGQIDMTLRMVVGRYSSIDVNMPRKHLAYFNVGGFTGT